MRGVIFTEFLDYVAASSGEDAVDRMLDLNVRSVLVVSRAVLQRWLRDGVRGAIVNLSSQMGHVGGPRRVLYCTTKHAVEGLTKALALEVAPHGIRVNAVAPTYVETPMTAPFLAEPAFRADVRVRDGLITEVRAGLVPAAGGCDRRTSTTLFARDAFADADLSSPVGTSGQCAGAAFHGLLERR